MTAAARRWCGFGLHGPGECAQEEEQGKADAVVLSLACNRIQQRESAAWLRALELGHGGRALARAAGAREGRQEANRERRVSRGGSSICIWGAGGRAARGDGEGTQRPCKKATRHIVEHVVRVEVGRVGVSSG